jgi:hypothetical protein
MAAKPPGTPALQAQARPSGLVATPVDCRGDSLNRLAITIRANLDEQIAKKLV